MYLLRLSGKALRTVEHRATSWRSRSYFIASWASKKSCDGSAKKETAWRGALWPQAIITPCKSTRRFPGNTRGGGGSPSETKSEGIPTSPGHKRPSPHYPLQLEDRGSACFGNAYRYSCRLHGAMFIHDGSDGYIVTSNRKRHA